MYKAGRVLAAGTKLFAALHSGTLDQLGGVVSIGGPNMSTESVDVTELDPYEGTSTLPANPEFFKEFVAGWRDTGAVEMTVNFTRATFANLLTWYRRGNDVDIEVRTRNGDVLAVVGHVTAVGFTREMNQLIQCPITIKVTGAPTFTAGP